MASVKNINYSKEELVGVDVFFNEMKRYMLMNFLTKNRNFLAIKKLGFFLPSVLFKKKTVCDKKESIEQ